MKLLKLLAVLTFVAGGLAGPAGAQEGGTATPNVVLILADDLGWGDVGAMHPASAIRTPHIDRLADEGMRFVDAHSPSGVCTPTRYALLTGRYAWRTRLTRGVLGGYSPPLLEPDRPTLGTLLQAQGYRTAAIGKWHLGMDMPYLDAVAERSEPWEGDPGIDFGGVIADGPIHHGFDEYFGVSASLDMAPYVYIRNDRLCVQLRLACSAGDSPAGATIRNPVAWIAGRRETEFLKPIDKVSLGETASHRAAMQMNAQVASRVRIPKAEPSTGRRRQHGWSKPD